MKIINLLVVVLIIAISIFVMSLIIIDVSGKEERGARELSDITGEVKSFEVSHEPSKVYSPAKKVSQRYDDEYMWHLWQKRELEAKSQKEISEDMEKSLKKLKAPDFSSLQLQIKNAQLKKILP